MCPPHSRHCQIKTLRRLTDTSAVIAAINNMLIDLMAAMSQKDWLSRRQLQKQGIERAHTLGKYRGKQADQERHQKVLYYRQVKKLSIRERQTRQGTVPPGYVAFRHCTGNKKRVIWVKLRMLYASGGYNRLYIEGLI